MVHFSEKIISHKRCVFLCLTTYTKYSSIELTLIELIEEIHFWSSIKGIRLRLTALFIGNSTPNYVRLFLIFSSTTHEIVLFMSLKFLEPGASKLEIIFFQKQAIIRLPGGK